MNIKKLPQSKVEISIVVPADEFSLCLKEATNELGKTLKVDGFRPGKAPSSLIEKTIGKEKLIATAAKRAVEKSYLDTVKHNSLEILGEPNITITKIAEGNDFEYKAEVAVMPVIKLGNYRDVAKENAKPAEKPVDPENIQKELDRIRKSRAKYITVTREVRLGDRVEIDFTAQIEGKEIEGGSSKNHALIIGEGYFIPGFEEQLIGMKEKEKKIFTISFPNEYHAKHLAGKPADFKATLNLVQESILPELNDEFAKSLGRFQTMEELKKSILDGLTEEQRRKVREEWRMTLLEKIMSGCTLDIPEILIENEFQKMFSEFSSNIAGTGMAAEEYLKKIGKSTEDLKKDWKEQAEKRVKAALTLSELFKLEQLDVPSDDVEKEMNKILAYYKNMKGIEDNLDLKSLFDYTKSMLKNEKVFEMLENIAKPANNK